MKKRNHVERPAGVRLIAGVLSAALTSSLFMFPGIALATIEGDQTPLSDEEIEAAIAAGEIEIEPDDGASAYGIQTMSSSFFETYSGADRYEVAAMEARAAYQTSTCAIVAGGEGWADALGAAGLAGVYDCPILLTEWGSLNSYASDALRSLGVTSVTIVGGPDTVSTNVEGQLSSMGIAVERIGGEDRYEVQTNIYSKALDSWSGGRIILASGVNYPDALSISPVSFQEKNPIFLVDANGGLNSYQKQLIESAAQSGKISEVIIAGGPNSVSSATEAYAKSVVGAGGSAMSVTRLGGADRYEASRSIANWAVQKGILSWDGVALAMGDKPYDALCGSVLQGKRASAMLIVSSNAANNTHPYGALRDNAGSISTLRVFGGKVSIPMTIRMDVADIFGIPYYEIPGLKVYVDAGHGWNDSNNGAYDPGAIGSGYREADLTKDLANRVASILESQYGVETFVNDDGGWYKLRHAEAKANGCDLIVSIHFNAGGGSGTETYIHSVRAAARSGSLQDAIHPRLVAGTALTDRGQHEGMLAILSGDLPAVLCEIAFIDNANDMRTYLARRDIIAAEIAEGAVNR